MAMKKLIIKLERSILVIVFFSKKNKLEVIDSLGINYGIKAFFKGKKEKFLTNQNVNKFCFSVPYLPEANISKIYRNKQ